MTTRGPSVSRHLFTTEPLPQSQSGYIRRQRAMVCAEEDCGVIFTAGPCCPNCASEQMIPLSVWLDRSRGRQKPAAPRDGLWRVTVSCPVWISSCLECNATMAVDVRCLTEVDDHGGLVTDYTIDPCSVEAAPCGHWPCGGEGEQDELLRRVKIAVSG
jgi:hypothetical protein